MADNTTLPAGSGGDIISTDVITTLNGAGIATGEKAQRVKVGWGVDGTLNDTNASNPLPVVQTGTPGLPTGAATSANQATEISSLATIATNTTTIPSAPSTNNSSTATLLAAATFTGTGDDCINYSEMRVTVFANVASATDGLSLQQSTDNSNWDVIDTYTIPAMTAGQAKTFVVPRQARYFRVVYTNGGTNQTTFRLQTLLNRTGTAPSSNRASDAYTNETDLVQNQAFLMGYNGTTWDRLRTTGTGVLTTSTVLTTGAATIGALVANQTVNVAQINGVTPLMGNGVTGTGSQRVTIASDNTPFTVNAAQATAANLNATVVGTGTFAVQTTADVPGTGATNLGKAEDNAHASGDTGVMALGVANEALTNISGTDGDYTPPATDRNGTVHVAQKASTATLSNVAGSATSVTLLAANTARIGAEITNDSSALLYIKFGTTASTTSYTVVLAGAASAPFSYYEIPSGYTGRIDGIWASAAGNARITEITP